MEKLSYEDKVKIYYKKKKGRARKYIASEYKIQESNVQYLVRLIDKHGFDVLRTVKNKYYSPSEKERIINRVLINNESSLSVAIDDYIYYYNYDRIKEKLKGLSHVNYRLQSSN